MTYLNMPPVGNNKNRTQGKPVSIDRDTRGIRRRGVDRDITTATPVPPSLALQDKIDAMVGEGRQADITTYFEGWDHVPARVGDWNICVNNRRQDNMVVGRTIVALPLSRRSRMLFEQGCVATLVKAGFSNDDALHYYAAAYKKKYVWVDTVISAVKEMIDAFQNTMVLDAYEQAGDPRRLAMTNKVPANPYLTSHTHFEVAIVMAKCVINARNSATVPVKESEAEQHPAPTTNMVLA